MSGSEPQTPPEKGRRDIDVAALSAGIIAVAVTAMVTPGLYGGFGTILALTLLILIIAYFWAGRRGLPHSIAFAAVIGLVGMQLAAFFVELRASPEPIHLIEGSDYGGAKAVVWMKAALQACAAHESVPGFDCPRTTFENALKTQLLDIQDKSRVNFVYLLLAWMLIGTVTLAVDRGLLFPGRWWPNSKAVCEARLARRSGAARGRAPGSVR